MNCPRCCKDTHGGYAHTCTPTEGWRKLADEIAELKRQLEDLSSDALVRANRIIRQKRKIVDMRRQLAESQAREVRLREALEYYRVNGHHEQSYNLACSALALQHDDTSLKEYRDAVIEECAVIAANSCLVPPDGGSPTVEEAASVRCAPPERDVLAACKKAP